MKECILVTGGAGFIGSALSGKLGGLQLPVVAFDNLHPQIHPSHIRPPALAPEAKLFVGDVCSSDDWDRFLTEHTPSFVVHLAAETGTGQSLTESVRHATVNVVGTSQMLDAFSRHSIKPRRIVLSSSRAVYGEGAWQNDDGEIFYPGQRDARMLMAGQWDFPGSKSLAFDARTTEARPTSVYGATKLAQEHLLAAWCNAYEVENVVLRLQNVYGPGQSLTNPYTGIVPLFSRIARRGDSIPLYEDGRMLRDFVYISDVADAIMQAVSIPDAPGKRLDIGSGRSISIGELATFISSRYGSPPPHVRGLFRNGDVRHAACNPESAMSALRWSPVVAVEDGLHRLCEWLDHQMEQEEAASHG